MNIGIIGSGSIVAEFIYAVKRYNESNPDNKLKITALAGRAQSEEKINKLCAEHNIEHIFFDVDQMLESGFVDVVYIGLINSLHFQYALKCISHKIPVMIEKPFTSNLRQAQLLYEESKKKGSIIFDMTPNRYFENVRKVKELLPRLGTIRLVNINYSQFSRRYEAFLQGKVLPVFDPKLAGGALMDLGVYNIYFMLLVFGQPTNYHYKANMINGIDTSGILSMSYSGEYNLQAVCINAKDCTAPLYISIQGDKGCINSSTPANIFNHFDLILNDGTKEHYELNTKEDRMVYELSTFIDIVKSDDKNKALNEIELTLKAMEILDNARLDAGMSISFCD